jgi:hypothetical protein
MATGTAVALDATECRIPDLKALGRTKGFLGVSEEAVVAMDQSVVSKYKAMSNEELFPIGERALADIADDIIVLDEIRTRFRFASGQAVMGYMNWREFVEKNSKYSVRTIQRRLTEVHGPDKTKVNDRFKQTAPAAPKPQPPTKTKETAPKAAPKKNQSRFHEADYYGRVGRCLATLYSCNEVDRRLDDIASIKKADWNPKAEKGVARLIQNLTEIRTQTDAYITQLKKLQRQMR